MAAQDETTTEEDGVETTTAAEAPANITFNEQESNGEQVVIESVTMEEGGFIAIHDSSVQEAPIASVLGNSVYLEAGTHENVTITLARPITESQTLVAMPHYDTNNNQVYDFVLSTGEIDGPYTSGEGAVTDSAEVTLAQETTTTTEAVEETTTTEVVDEETTTADDVIEETTTEENEFETTTEEDVVETTTTEEDVVEETTTEEDVEETTTEEDVVEETTTTEEVVEETTTTEEPADQQRLVFKIEQMQIDEWSFVVGDEEEPDRTEVISNVNVQDRRVVINLTQILQEQQEMAAGETMTTVDPEEAQEQLEENLTGDIQTVRFVIRNVNVENVTFVIIAPEGMELPEPPMTTTTEEVVEETTTTEEVVEETTTTEEVVEETTTTTEEVVEETTTTEEDVVEETTTTEEVVEETTTTTEEVVEETTTTEEVVEETTTAAEEDLDSFEVSNLDAPESASIGDTITVSATVSNPNDQQATQDVAFRLDGTVVARESVTLAGGEQTNVTFEIDTSDVPAGQYIHGIYTRDFGELAVIVLEEPTAETTTTTEEETTAAEETTTTEEA